MTGSVQLPARSPDFQLLKSSPVLRKLKPKIPGKERKHLRIEDSLRLLKVVQGQKFELAVWLGLVAGLRAGEIQALKWDNIDLIDGILHIRSTYARKEKCFRDYPKGKKWHSIKMPPELWNLLKNAKNAATSDFVVPGKRNAFFCYNSLMKSLKGYCTLAGVEELQVHELRHSSTTFGDILELPKKT